MKKLVNGQLVDLTPQEIAEREAEEAAFLAAKPTKDWERAMAETDAKLPRYVEDILDALDKPTRDKVAKKTLDAYNEKKAKRAEKP